jgi:hypothetical protein
MRHAHIQVPTETSRIFKTTHGKVQSMRA